MNNTRKKATASYEIVKKKYGDEIKIMYLSSGIRKCDRQEKIKLIKECQKEPMVVVSTQVMEAGVDVSFSEMFREIAPLDNIIQAMGRLDREANASIPSTLTVFETDNSAIPYVTLEFEKTLSVIKEIAQNRATSQELYDRLDKYYREISSANEANREKLKELENQMRKMNFEQIWKIIKKNVFEESSYRDVIIPMEEEFESMRDDLISMLKRDDDRKTKKKIMKRFAKYTASLPISPSDLRINEYFDVELKGYNILFPKKNCINELYDVDRGLDKWTQKP